MNFVNLVLLPIIARICLVVMFPLSAYDKIVHWDEAISQARTAPLAGSTALLVIAILVEFITPICIVLGWHDRASAFILAGFCVVTALLYHPFWSFSGFWRKDGEGRAHFWDFWKNFGLVGGLLLLVISNNFVPASYVLSHPLSSVAYAAKP